MLSEESYIIPDARASIGGTKNGIQGMAATGAPSFFGEEAAFPS